MLPATLDSPTVGSQPASSFIAAFGSPLPPINGDIGDGALPRIAGSGCTRGDDVDPPLPAGVLCARGVERPAPRAVDLSRPNGDRRSEREAMARASTQLICGTAETGPHEQAPKRTTPLVAVSPRRALVSDLTCLASVVFTRRDLKPT